MDGFNRWTAARFRGAGVLLGGLFALGCASSGGSAASLRHAISERLETAGIEQNRVEIPFEPTEEMRSWVLTRVGRAGDPERKLDRLLAALLERNGKLLEYERSWTRTAREVWEAHRANCLSFSHLFIGLARELGLPAYYLKVSDLQRFERDQDLVVASEHVTAAFGPPNQRRILEFSDRPAGNYRELEPLSDLAAVALHYSNRGAEALRAGDLDRALRELEIAVAVEPELADGWVNLGVAQRRLGDLAGAERSYRRALEVDPRQASAYHNLILLLERTGRAEEAAALRAVLASGMSRNPYSYLALGDWALRSGRLPEAERFYRRALRLEPPLGEVAAALGVLAVERGDARVGGKWLRRAERLDPTAPRVEALRALLERDARKESNPIAGSPRSQPPPRPSRG